MSYLLILVSLVIVAMGQPAFSIPFSLLTATIGLGLFWKAILNMSRKGKFWTGTGWFFAIQLFQLSWLLSHPYWYIITIWIFISALVGFSFGLISSLVSKKTLNSFPMILAISGLATLLEWSRLFLLSGFSWNPLGLSWTVSLYALQFTSLFGIFGLSYWTYLTNLLALRAYETNKKKLFFVVLFIPFFFGAWHFKIHSEKQKESPLLSALLVQTAFPIEETLVFPSVDAYQDFVRGEWEDIFNTLSKYRKDKVDLIVLPEFVVPFGTYTPIYPYEKIERMLKKYFPHDQVVEPTYPYAQKKGGAWLVSNAYILSSLANYFNADVISGLEDAEFNAEEHIEYYSSAYFFPPFKNGEEKRYEKRVLVPMGEYIPLKPLENLAKSYGISGSFTPGTEAKVFQGKTVPMGLSVCYEETYGGLMRENKLKGAELLVNVTSDVWYPNSKLPRQHLDHARPRSVEGGYPLIRSCNTGVTCAIDCLGQTLKELKGEWTKDALLVQVPLYAYPTLYSQTGDFLVILFSIFSLAGFKTFLRRKH